MHLSVAEARRQVARAIDAACAGEDVIIERRHEPVVRLVPIKSREKMFPAMAAFRSSMRPSPGKVSSVDRLRNEARA
jgi:prevent-host-death family protein